MKKIKNSITLQKVWFAVSVVFITIAVIVIGFRVKHPRVYQDYNAPYYSGAVNLKLGGSFLINLEECLAFRNASVKEQMNFRFKENHNLINYRFNPIGYSYLVKYSLVLFPWLSSVNAMLLFQLLVHAALGCWILYKLNKVSLIFRVLFIILFILNPILLKFIAFDFYYCWQLVVSELLLLLLWSRSKYEKILLNVLIILIVPATLSARLTLVFLIPIFIYLFFVKFKGKQGIILTFLFIISFFIIHKPINKSAWHTIYIGLAAYPNQHIDTLHDYAGFNKYKELTGTKINPYLGGNFYDPSTIDNYHQVLKREYFKIIKVSPFLPIKNAFLNTAQLYSVGYFNDAPLWIKYFLALLGLLHIIYLIIKRRWILFLLILLPSLGFVFYYPPIPIYMFGSYIFLVLSYLWVLSDILLYFTKDSRWAIGFNGLNFFTQKIK